MTAHIFTVALALLRWLYEHVCICTCVRVRVRVCVRVCVCTSVRVCACMRDQPPLYMCLDSFLCDMTHSCV